MSNVIMDLQTSIYPWQRNKKFPVRLRLRKKKHHSQQNQQQLQNGIVTTTLKQHNNRLSANIDELTNIQTDSLNVSLKKCLSSIANHHSNQLKYQNQIVCGLVKRLKQNLKIFHGEYLLTLNQNQRQKSKLVDSSQLTAGSSLKLKIPEIQKHLASVSRCRDEFTSGSSSKIQQQQSLQQKQQQSNHKQKYMKNSYKQLFETNSQLKGQVIEMENYIQILKQQLVEKQNHIEYLSLRSKEMHEQNEKLRGLLDVKQAQFKILQQEIVGYEQKIQSLEQQIMELSNTNSRSNSQCGSGSNPNTISQSLSKGLSISIEEQINQSDRQQNVEIRKLERIYKKTEQTLRNYYKIQKQKEQLNNLCDQLRIKVQEILNTIYDICDQERSDMDISNMQLKQIIRVVGEVLDRKLSIIQLQHNQRQAKLQAMIAQELDQTLAIISAIQSNQDQQGPINQQSTILDRLQYLRNKIQYMYLNISNRINPKSYFNTLLQLYSRVDAIIDRSYHFGVQLQNNAATLAAVQKVLQEKQQHEVMDQDSRIVIGNGRNIVGYLAQLQELLMDNQKYLTHDNIGYVNFYKMFCLQNGINVTKIQEYLGELQQIIQQLYRNQDSNIKLNEQIKNYTPQHDIILEQNTLRSIKQETTKLQRKYFPSNPQFIDTILHQLIQIRKINNQESFLTITHNIFKAIKNRDQKFSQQMGRRKQILKQRAAAISQICRKGIKDSSIEEHSFTKKQ